MIEQKFNLGEEVLETATGKTYFIVKKELDYDDDLNSIMCFYGLDSILPRKEYHSIKIEEEVYADEIISANSAYAKMYFDKKEELKKLKKQQKKDMCKLKKQQKKDMEVTEKEMVKLKKQQKDEREAKGKEIDKLSEDIRTGNVEGDTIESRFEIIDVDNK